MTNDGHLMGDADSSLPPEERGNATKWCIEDFTLGRAVGRGRFGSVYACRDKASGRPLALKILFKENLQNTNVAQQLKHEVEIHCRLRHPNIMRCYGYFEDQHRVFVVMDLAARGTLHRVLQHQPNHRLSEGVAAFYVQQLLQALLYLHEQRLLHGDIKPEYLLLDANGNLKVSDLGWSVGEGGTSNTSGGSLAYLAPEQLRQESYGPSAETWAVGVLTHEMLMGRTPFPDALADRRSGANLMMPESVSAEAKDFVRGMLLEDPSTRPTFQGALKHAWLIKAQSPPEAILPDPSTWAGPRPGEDGVRHAAVGEGSSPSSEGRRTNGGKEWSIDDFSIGRPIGKGRYGSVYMCKEKASGKVVAVKILFKQQLLKDGVTHQVRNEIEIHSRIRHPHIVTCYGYFHDQHRVYICMDYAPGELYTKLKTTPQGRFSDRMAAKYIGQLLGALSVLHDKQYIHRDLKPENLLLSTKDDLLLADFGWSIASNQGAPRQTLCGTPDYIAPEMIKNEPYSESVDIWTIGVLAYEFLVGQTPFRHQQNRGQAAAQTQALTAGLQGNDDGLYDSILTGRIHFPPHVTPQARDFISKLLVLDPACRLRLSEAMRHPWIATQDTHATPTTTTNTSGSSNQESARADDVHVHPAQPRVNNSNQQYDMMAAETSAISSVDRLTGGAAAGGGGGGDHENSSSRGVDRDGGDDLPVTRGE